MLKVVFFGKAWDDLQESAREMQATMGWLSAVSATAQNQLLCSYIFVPFPSPSLTAHKQGMQVIQSFLLF